MTSYTPYNQPTFKDGTKATTQPNSDSSTKIATTEFVKNVLVASLYDYQSITSNNFTFSLDVNILQYFIGAKNTFSSNLIITLPVISQKCIINIKDESFTSNKYQIKILPSGTDLIDNTDSFIIKSKGASVSFYNDNNGNWYSF